MKIHYEYCAFRFLELWEKHEKDLHEDMQGTPSAYQIRNVLNHYRVARNFKGLSDEFAEKISAHLVEVSDSRTEQSRDKVIELAGRFEKDFEQLSLSAASKLLWLRNQSPYRIYDAQAIKGLARVAKFRKGDYKSYCETWESQYEPRSSEISRAANGLVNLMPREYTAAPSLTDAQLLKLVSANWFRERVFDIYLWEIGSKHAEAIRES
jgi:hypothetical protein